MSDQVYFHPQSVYSKITSNPLSSGPVQLPHNVNRQPDSPASVNFDTSWIKSHINPNITKSNKKKLTHFLDTLLTYDVKNGPENQNEKVDNSLLLKVPDHNIANPKSGFNNQSGEMGRTVKDEFPLIQENKEVHKETEKINTELRFEEYITETWEKYRKRYEHLGEKNPFTNDPPTPEFLLRKYRFSGQRDQRSSNERKQNYGSIHKGKNVNVSMCDANHEAIVPPQSLDQNLDITTDLTNVTKRISNENNAPDSLEPDLELEAEELDFQSESNSESDQVINNDDSFLPIEDETQLADNVSGVHVHKGKQSAERYIEDHVTERSNEYDEINYQKSKENPLKSALPDVRSLSTNEENYSPNRFIHTTTDTKVNDLEQPQQPEKSSRAFRKSSRNPQKQHVLKTSTHEHLRPLVNPYLLSPLGSAAMMPPLNSLYPFQPPLTPFNYWVAKPPFNQCNMFPYGYPWQSLPFTPPYYQHVFQHNMAPPSYVGQHNISPTSPLGLTAPSAQGLLNVPSTEVSAGLGYGTSYSSSPAEIPANEIEEFKPNNNQAKRGNRPYQSQFQKSELNPPHPGYQVQQHQNFHQRHRVNKVPNQSYKHDQKWIKEKELNNSVNSYQYGRQSTQMFDPPDVRQNPLNNSYNPRINQSTLPSSQFKMEAGSRPQAYSYHWNNREHSNLGPNWSKSQVSPPPLPPLPPPINHLQHRMNEQKHQYGTPTNEYERTRVRSNTEFPTQHLGEQPSVPPSPYHSWYTDPSQYGYGHFSPHNYSAEGPPAQ